MSKFFFKKISFRNGNLNEILFFAELTLENGVAKCEFSVPSTINSAARSGGQFLPTYDLASSRFHLLLAVGPGSTAALKYHTSRLETREAVDLTEYSGGASPEAEAEGEGEAEAEAEGGNSIAEAGAVSEAEAEAESEGGAEPEGSLPEVKAAIFSAFLAIILRCMRWLKRF